MEQDAARFRGTLYAATQTLYLPIPGDVWPALPSNAAAFDALTPQEEGALRSLLAAIWLTEGLEEGLRQWYEKASADGTL